MEGNQKVPVEIKEAAARKLQVEQREVPLNGSEPKQEIKEMPLKREGVIYLDPKRASELPWDTMCVL